MFLQVLETNYGLWSLLVCYDYHRWKTQEELHFFMFMRFNIYHTPCENIAKCRWKQSICHRFIFPRGFDMIASRPRGHNLVSGVVICWTLVAGADRIENFAEVTSGLSWDASICHAILYPEGDLGPQNPSLLRTPEIKGGGEHCSGVVECRRWVP